MRHSIRFFSAIFFLTAFTFSSVQAAPSAEITKGLNWLQGQVQTNGSLSNEVGSIATIYQARAEALYTLALLATSPASLLSVISADTEENTEYLSRKTISLGLNGLDTNQYVNQLLQLQNSDGGLGGSSDYSSNVTDTAWAVLALAQAGKATSTAAVAARTYLVTQISLDGGIADPDRLHQSAIALLALQTAPDGSNASAIRNLTSWILQQQGADGSWSGDPYLSAFALAAISPVTADVTVRGSASNFLLSKQAADGGWNADPFLTAVILRALSTQYSSLSTTTGVLKGQLKDSATNAPLSGVSVSLTGSSNQVTVTDASGNFAILGLIAGNYSVSYSRSGYNTANASYSITSGQTSDAGIIGLTQLATAGIIRGLVTSAANNTPLVGVTISVTGATNASTVSDTAGRYEIDGVTPGAILVSASLVGYQSVSGSGTVIAGQTVVFSPSIYPNGQVVPTATHYVGTVVSAGQATPLAGVAIQITGASNASVVTTATGQFDVTLSPGSYSASFSLTGYGTVTQTFVAPVGTTVAAGIVTMAPIKTTSTIKGQVLNASNVGISGATVQVVGTLIVGTTGANGSYTLNNVEGTNLSIRASATGYNSQSINLQLSAPGDWVQNFSLSVQNAVALSIGDLAVTPPTVGSATDVSVATTIVNTGSTARDAIIRLQILDKDQKAIGTGVAYDGQGNLIGQVNLAAGQQQDVKLVWNSAQFPAGAYTLDLQLLETGSISRATPQGNLLVERAASVTVTAQVHFTGSIVSNPPVLQAGTNTTVKISAVVKNDGNGDIPAQTFTLMVINTKDNLMAHTEQIAVGVIAVNGLQTITFTDWIPTTGANFRLELAAADPALGKVVGSLYVGDSAKATYTVDKLVVPTGTQVVRGTIKVTGQDVTTGVISDPLAPLIKTAVQKAVAYNYAAAAYDTTSSRCNRCHVQAQAIVGGELTRKLTNYISYASSRDIILNELTTHQKASGAIDDHPATGVYERAQTMLGLWALNTWHQKDEVLVTLAKGASYLVNTQAGDGHWDTDYAYGWWNTTVANTAFSVKSLTETYQSLKQSPSGTPIKYTATPWVSQGVVGPYHLTSDAAGNVYVSNYNNGTILLVKADGTTQSFMTGLQNPTALVFASDGTAYASSYGGLYRRNADGTATQISTHHGSGLAIAADGNLYMSSYWDNKIFQITPAGVASDYISAGLLSNPWGIAFTNAGDLVVANYGSQTIARYRPNLVGDIVVTLVPGNPYALQANGSGWLVTTGSGLYSYSADWHGQRLIYSNLGGATATPDGTIVVGDVSANALYKVVGAPIASADYAKLDTAIAGGTNWLLQDGNTDSNNNLSLAQRLIGLNAAKLYYKGQPLADTLQAKMVAVGTQLRSRVLADGGWGWTPGYGSDSLVTAQVGVALDALNPSASDPIVQNAVKLLLNRQHADGTWYSENNILSTPIATTTWVSIWLPTVLDRLGGVDTDLTVTFPTNVAMTNPDLAPTSTTVNADGSNTFVWKMRGVTSAGQAVSYDLSLANMALDEVRPVSTDAHLTFTNSFTSGVVNAAIDIPRVKASAFLELGITTDKLTYPANSVVNILAQVTSTGANLSSGKVKFEIYAADKTLVETIGTVPFSGLAAGANVKLGINWNTVQTLSGAGYYVLGTLYDSSDRQVGTAQSVFGISGIDSATTGLAAKLTADKLSYLPSDVVKLNDRLTNTTLNTLLNNVSITTTVISPGGTVIFTKGEVIPQLTQGNLKDFAYSLPLNFAPAGVYNAALIATAVDGTLLAKSSTQFTVGSTTDSGSGLRGSLFATPKQVPLGDAVLLSSSTANLGNANLVGISLTTTIVDPVSQTVVAQWPETVTLIQQQSYGVSRSWITQGIVGQTYVAVLTAVVGGKTITLSQDSFTLLEPPVKLDVVQGRLADNRILVLAACTSSDSSSDTSEESYSHSSDDGESKHSDDSATKSYSSSGGDDYENSSKKTCGATRAKSVDAYMAIRNIKHMVTTDENLFRKAMRSGYYNVYWLSGGSKELTNDIEDELAEAVYRGDSLILDNLSGPRASSIIGAAGVYYKGARRTNSLTATTTGALFPIATRAIAGVPAYLKLTSGQVQATFVTSRSSDDESKDSEEHSSSSPITNPGIVSNQYGAGRAIVYGFDMLTSLQGTAGWNSVFDSALDYLKPPIIYSLTGGGYVPVVTSITNQAKAVDLEITLTAPPGGYIENTLPLATVDSSGQPVWHFSLAESAKTDLLAGLRLPLVNGTATLTTKISSIRNGQAIPYRNYKIDFTVKNADTRITEVINGLNTLSISDSDDNRYRNSAVTYLNSAAPVLNGSSSQLNTALNYLVEAAKYMAKISSMNVISYRTGTDQIIQETQFKWFKLQP